MLRKNKNAMNLMLYSMLILSVIDFFHFANHAFGCHSHIISHITISANSLDHNIYFKNFDHLALAESKSCHICSSLITFEAILCDNSCISFVVRHSEIDTKPYLLASHKIIQLYNPRAPPYFI